VPDLQQALADGFARVIRSAPGGSLERILRTPVRRAVLDGIFWQIPQHLASESATGLTAVVHWHIRSDTGGRADIYELAFDGGRCRAYRGPRAGEPQLTITLDAAEFVRLATGNANPMQAYFSGRIVLGGDIMLAAKLQALFRIPGTGVARQSRSTVSSSR
jgi:putative sterol carrier protein